MSFADQVDSWTRETESRMTAVWRASVGTLASEMVRTKANGGSLPHLTGNLMRSLLMSTTRMPSVLPSGFRFNVPQDPGALAATLRLGDTVFLGYQAAYARRMNYGFVGEDSLGRSYNQAGNHFLERAIALWPAIVAGAIVAVREGK